MRNVGWSGCYTYDVDCEGATVEAVFVLVLRYRLPVIGGRLRTMGDMGYGFRTTGGWLLWWAHPSSLLRASCAAFHQLRVSHK